MIGTSHRALFLGAVPGKGSTLSRVRSTSAPELSSSVALVPLSKGGTSEDLIIHTSHEVQIRRFQNGEAPANQTKPKQFKIFIIKSLNHSQICLQNQSWNFLGGRFLKKQDQLLFKFYVPDIQQCSLHGNTPKTKSFL